MTNNLNSYAKSNSLQDDTQVTALTLQVLTRFLSGKKERDFAVRLWNGTVFQASGVRPAKFTLVLNHPGALRRMLFPPSELALGEAYLSGDWDLEGDVIQAMHLGDAFEGLAMSVKDLLSLSRLAAALPSGRTEASNVEEAEIDHPDMPKFTGPEHSKERDKKAVSYHYDASNDFYRLWLDRRMVYSCAYFPTGREDIERAQEAKLEHICRKLLLREGDRLLDIGCGWGGLIIHAAEKFGVDATGITLSEAQAQLARERITEAGLADRCRVLIMDYRDLPGVRPFDKIASIGMVEHVGWKKLQVYFQSVWQSLRAGGLFLNHGISGAARDVASFNLLDRYLFKRGAFIRKYVFPDGELVPVGEMLRIAEQSGFEVRDVENWREHYALTLEYWVKRLEKKKEEALKHVDERTYRIWRLYMAGCAHAFKSARMNVGQVLLAKPDESGRCDLPFSRAHLYDLGSRSE